jgi:hypothetical protein
MFHSDFLCLKIKICKYLVLFKIFLILNFFMASIFENFLAILPTFGEILAPLHYFDY